MRVAAYLHLYAPYHFAGSEIYLHELLKTMQVEGHEVKVFATDETPGEWVFDDVKCVAPRAGISLDPKVKAFQPDVILTHHKATPAAAHVARVSGAKLIQVVHNERPYMDMLLAHGADFVIYNSQHVADKLSAKFPMPYTVLYPPTWPEKHRTGRGDRVTLINLQPDKGSHVFYDMANRLPSVKFLGVEGGYGEQRFDKYPNVVFQRQTTDMKNDVWAKTSILLVPSAYESWGMVGVEALASGIPVIAAPTPGLLESLSYAGIFVECSDREGWAAEITRLLNDDDAYAEASKRALTRSAELNPTEPLKQVTAQIDQLIKR